MDALTNDLTLAEELLARAGHSPMVLEEKQLISFFSSYYRKNNLKMSNKEIDLNSVRPEKVSFKRKYIVEKFKDKTKYIKTVSITDMPLIVSKGWLADIISSVPDNVIVKTYKW